ncbi:hypothetical protein CEXT_462341 [Caerostris extrusa]|uniref:Uncharacterized protein n=1 Tax=Caerostris extrusa TaxID=172846 RepID=A0AAV4U0V8_CAEEX|nr:hypothetical protein CEXT_462341 [Caerostris extrusa]
MENYLIREGIRHWNGNLCIVKFPFCWATASRILFWNASVTEKQFSGLMGGFAALYQRQRQLTKYGSEIRNTHLSSAISLNGNELCKR